jgi:hypothetical protein
MSDHDAYEWVAPRELLDWDLAPADIPIAKAYVESVFASDDHSHSLDPQGSLSSD